MKLDAASSFQRAVLAGLFMLANVGCGSGTSSGATSTGSTSTSTAPPAVPAGWTNIDRPYFSFSYPSGYTITEVATGTEPYVQANDPAQLHQVSVQFIQGFVNQGSTFQQCAGVDALLTQIYTDNFLSMQTAANKYPQISVTKTGPAVGGALGGDELDISVVTKAAVGSTNGGYTYRLEGGPRTDGLYIVGIQNPDDFATPSFVKTFLGTVVMKSKALPSGAYCNYLG